MKHKLKISTFALGLFALASVDAQAQVDQGAQSAASASSTAYAGASFGSPLAFGASWGDVGVGIFGQTIRKAPGSNDNTDGSLGLVFGLGNPDRYVGLETGIGISSITSANNSNFGDAGSLGFKLHTNLPDGAAFAVGVVGTGRWGAAKAANVASVYAVGTKVFALNFGNSNHALVLNLGLGDGQFNDAGKSGAGLFGSVAFYLSPQISLIADYTGTFTNLGVSAAPFAGVPLTITAGAINVSKRFSPPLDTEFGVSVGYGFHF